MIVFIPLDAENLVRAMVVHGIPIDLNGELHSVRKRKGRFKGTMRVATNVWIEKPERDAVKGEAVKAREWFNYIEAKV